MDRRLRNARIADECWQSASEAARCDPQRIDVDGSVRALRSSVRSAAKKYVPAHIALLDEALQFLIQADKALLSHAYGASAFAFYTLVSRMKCLVVAFRELILLGQADAARLIARALLENSELATVSAADAAFAEAYAPDDPDADDQKFWKSRVGYGKIYPALKATYVQAASSDEFAEHAARWRQGWKDDLSGAVHSASWSAFQCAFIPSLDQPESGRMGALGHLSAHSPPLCRLVIDEVLLFSRVLMNLLHSENVPDNLRGLRDSPRLKELVVAAGAFESLHNALYDELDKESPRLASRVENESATEEAQQIAAGDAGNPRA